MFEVTHLVGGGGSASSSDATQAGGSPTGRHCHAANEDLLFTFTYCRVSSVFLGISLSSGLQ